MPYIAGSGFDDVVSEFALAASTVLLIPFVVAAFAHAYIDLSDNIQVPDYVRLVQDRDAMKENLICAPDDPKECLYFSVVTFTTLGYGDITPKSREAKAIAVMQALIGFLFVPILISQLVNLLRDIREEMKTGQQAEFEQQKLAFKQQSAQFATDARELEKRRAEFESDKKTFAAHLESYKNTVDTDN